MRLQRRIIWATLIISLISISVFIIFSTFAKVCDYNNIISGIAIALFGSALLVLVPAIITFNKNKEETKQKIISELIKIENLLIQVHFQTTFLKDIDGQYSLDFSFEKTKYELAKNFSLYTAHKDIYDINSKRVEILFDTISAIDNYNYTLLDTCLDDYVRVLGNEKLIRELFKKHFDIIKKFMIRHESSTIEYGARQYKACNASMGAFFDIWFKKFLLELEPIDKKIDYLFTIKNIMKLRFYKTSYKSLIESEDENFKNRFKESIEQFYKENNLEKPKYIINLLDKLAEKNIDKAEIL